jgi:hypothetical protein
MATQAKPARRRIVPEQILSPTKSQAETDSLKTAAGPRLELGDLKEHSAVATELLGAGRKVYIDLAAYQRSEKEVDWKEVSHIFPHHEISSNSTLFYNDNSYFLLTSISKLSLPPLLILADS